MEIYPPVSRGRANTRNGYEQFFVNVGSMTARILISI